MKRFLPASGTELDRVEALAQQLGFEPGQTSDSDDEPLQRTWLSPDGQMSLHWVYDDIIDLEYVAVDGPRVDELAARVTEELSTVDWHELLADVRGTNDWYELVPAIYRLAIAAPTEPHPEILKVLEDMACHPNPVIRQAVYVATVYINWPPLKALLEKALAQEEDDDARALARSLLPAFSANPQG
jgi:hypothetical protein